MRLNAPCPPDVIIFVSAVVEPGPRRFACPNKQTPVIIRSEMLRVRFFFLSFVTQRSVGRKISRLRSLCLHPRHGDHGRNYRNGSQHCGKDHPPLSGDVS